MLIFTNRWLLNLILSMTKALNVKNSPKQNFKHFQFPTLAFRILIFMKSVSMKKRLNISLKVIIWFVQKTFLDYILTKV